MSKANGKLEWHLRREEAAKAREALRAYDAAHANDGAQAVPKAQAVQKAQPYTLLSDLQTKPATYLWHPRISYGEITLIDGDPGSGKSSIILDLAARLTTGSAMPNGGEGAQGGVILLLGEDSIQKTVLPRLAAAGADLTRIATPDIPITIPDGLPIIKETARKVGAKLLVIDPLMSFLGPNAMIDQNVRKALTPLAELANKTGMAVVVVRHLTKGNGRHALYRGSGSIGIIAATRSALLVAKAPHDADLRVLAQTKNNLGPLAPCLLFEPVATETGMVRIEWRREFDCKIEDLLKNGAQKVDRLEKAKDFLLDVLAIGPVLQQDVRSKATEAGLAWRTVERAKEALGVESNRQGWGPGSKCYWSLHKNAS